MALKVLWQLLTALYEDELIEEPHRRYYYLKHRATEGVASRKYSGLEIDMMISTTSTLIEDLR